MNIDRIRAAIRQHGFQKLAYAVACRDGTPLPKDNSLAAAMQSLSEKVARIRAEEQEMLEGIAAYRKVKEL